MILDREVTNMRRIMAIVLVVVLVFAMATVAFASTEVVSPEKENTNPNVNPNGDKSHQTGESISVVWIVIAAVALLGVAFFCGKKFLTVK